MKRVIPVGTRMRGRCVAIQKGFVLIKGEDGEGYVLIGTGSTAEIGDDGDLEFMAGGPLNGYWRFTPDD